VQSVAGIIPGSNSSVLPFMAAFTVETSDLQLAKNVLVANGTSFTEKAGRLLLMQSMQAVVR
jgi:hypothetical protein